MKQTVSGVLLLLFGFAMCRAFAEEPRAIGLSVEPGGLLIQNVPVGQLYDMDYWMKMRFKIANDSGMPRKYALRVDKPSRVGVKLLKGYTEIPNPDWFWFEKNEVFVAAGGTAEVKMFLRIPNEDKYANQRWAVAVDVEARPEAEEKLVLALSPVFYIETEAKATPKELPAGFTALVPGTVVVDHVAIGKRTDGGSATLYNNDSQPHLYTVTSVVPSAEPGRQTISPSPRSSWLPNVGWVKVDKRTIKLGPRERRDLHLRIDVPKDPRWQNQDWETLLYVESEDGLASFARIQIKTHAR